MKKFMLLLLFTGFSGSAQSLDFGNDLILDATESQNFKELFLEMANKDMNGLSELIFLVATGSQIPSGTATVTINTAQKNRWINKADKGSFASRAIFLMLNESVVSKNPFLASAYIAEATSQATLHISNTNKRTRFLSNLQSVYNKENYE